MDWLRLESPAYWITFTASFLLVAVWESWRPNRECIVPAGQRWKMHGILLCIVMVVTTTIFRLSPVAAAIAAQGNPWGVLGFESIPFAVRAVAGFLLLDFTKYFTHWLYHHVSFLWPIHRVHHSDPDFDVSTGGRFHPLEPLVKGGVKPDHWGGEKVDHSTGWRCLSLKELRGWLERRPATRVAGRVLGRSGSRPRNLAPRVEGGDYERGLAGRFCLLSLSR